LLPNKEEETRVPKGAEYHIAWSEDDQAYVLRHAPFSFPLTDDTLQYWLKLIEAFHFQAASGDGVTVRKETKQRGTAYWYAYRRVDGKLRKKYLGDTSRVTLALLATIAHAFVAPPESD
jgi:LuxR family maltose regulon positive regulatory protein